MTGVFLEPGDPLWTDFLQKVSYDVYHLPGYGILSSRYEGGVPVAFYAREGEDAMLVPLLLRQVPHSLNNLGDVWDATSPYGYPAPLFSRPDNLHGCRNLIATMIRTASERGLASLFLRLHPLISSPLATLSQMGSLVKRGKTVSIDLCRSLEELLHDTSTNHRRNIRKLSRAGFRVVLDSWDNFPEFVRLYRLNMIRVGACPFYFFKGTYFDDLRQYLKDHIHICSVLSPSGELASAGLFTVADRFIEYHLGASNEDYLGLAPSKMLFDFMRRWGQQQGLQFFHLGGGHGSHNDSLFSFKAGFSSYHTSFHTFHLVLDKAVYSTLCTDLLTEADRSMDNDAYFPLYRKHLNQAGYNNKPEELG